jgi:hypothetical protein
MYDDLDTPNKMLFPVPRIPRFLFFFLSLPWYPKDGKGFSAGQCGRHKTGFFFSKCM